LKKLHFIYILAFLTCVPGCVSLGTGPRSISADTLYREYIQKAGAYEVSGDLVAALAQYKLAMTVNPSDERSAKRVKKLEMTLREMAEKHYRAGIKLNNEGRYGRG